MSKILHKKYSILSQNEWPAELNTIYMVVEPWTAGKSLSRINHCASVQCKHFILDNPKNPDNFAPTTEKLTKPDQDAHSRLVAKAVNSRDILLVTKYMSALWTTETLNPLLWSRGRGVYLFLCELDFCGIFSKQSGTMRGS